MSVGMLLAASAVAVALLGVPLAHAQIARSASPSATVGSSEHFNSPEEGFAALADAARNQDIPRVVAILGPEGRPVVESGDPVADRSALERFATAYGQAHAIQFPTPNRAILQVGPDSWPLPIPMVSTAGQWRFDARAGGEEILNRRIGANELSTIQTLRAIVDAQHEYARTAGRRGALRAYARRFVSSPGQHDGLYWDAAPGQPPSPLGALFAEASGAGYRAGHPGDPPQRIHGYYFRILEGQGRSAPGGATSYLYQGQMIGGFAVVAWPAEYGRSGIRTFMVNHDGHVWQRDLGRNTSAIGRAITSFDPRPGWQRVPD